VKTLYITPGSPWENGYSESFNGSPRDELLNGESSTASPSQGADRGVAASLQHRPAA